MKGFKIIFCMLLSLCCMKIDAETLAGRSTKNRFYLLSKYTKEEPNINRQEFAQAYNHIAQRGTLVYRNGQTYHVLVPLRELFIKGTDNYAHGGKDLVANLASFLSFYNIEYIKLVGLYHDNAEPEAPASKNSGLKGDHGKQVTAKLDKKPRQLPADLVSLRQTSRLVTFLQKTDTQFSRINISVTDEIESHPSFLSQPLVLPDNGRETLTPAHLLRALRSKISSGDLEESTEEIFSDGAIMMEFKIN